MAKAHSWPAQVLIQVCVKNVCRVCGGSLIDFTTVITAGILALGYVTFLYPVKIACVSQVYVLAHCTIFSNNSDSYTVVFGNLFSISPLHCS